MVNITIQRVDNGFIVEAGCMRLAFNNKTELAVELTRWLENPEKVEAEYQARYRQPQGDAAAGVLGGFGGMVDSSRNARIHEYGRATGAAMPTDNPTRERLRGADGGPDEAPRDIRR